MAIINLIDGEKGGVGKSWVARTMLQYLIDNAIPRASIETDRSNPTVLNIYKEFTKVLLWMSHVFTNDLLTIYYVFLTDLLCTLDLLNIC